MSDIDKKWYVVRAISGQEKKIKDVLEAEIAAAGLQHYVGQILFRSKRCSKSATERR